MSSVSNIIRDYELELQEIDSALYYIKSKSRDEGEPVAEQDLVEIRRLVSSQYAIRETIKFYRRLRGPGFEARMRGRFF